MKEGNKIKFGIPWEYLREGAVELLKISGYEVDVDEHSYRIEINNPEIKCVVGKVEELADWAEKGRVDLGITEKAFILEARARVIKLADLNYGYKTWKKSKIVLVVPENSKIKSVKDLKRKKIATWLPEITKDYFKKKKIKVRIESTSLPAEAKCQTMVDGAIEFVNTGVSLKKAHLKILDVLMESSPWLIGNKISWQASWKRKKMETLAKELKRARMIKEQELISGIPREKNQLDDIDLKILRLLCQDGRKSFVEIAKETNLSPVGVKNRVDKLINQGILKIQGLLNITKFYSVSASFSVEVDDKVLSNFMEKLKKSSLIYYLAKTSGDYNLLIGIVTSNLKAIDDFIIKEIKSEPGVKHIKVSIGELPVVPKGWSPPIY